MKRLAVLVLLCLTSAAWSAPPRDLADVRWDAGADDCDRSTQPPLQVHRYASDTFILRQNLCVEFEGNFLYLLIGGERALLIDSGAVEDPDRMPLAATIAELLRRPDGSAMPLVVAHTHGHRDHRAGDAQFVALPSVEIVPPDLDAVIDAFGLHDWPEGSGRLDLGGRVVEVVPAPGHHAQHVLFYDPRTRLVFTGDFLLPGRLLVSDVAAYRASAVRAAGYFRARPVAAVLGGHVELDRNGRLFPHGSNHHPAEHPLPLGKQDLLALPETFERFNGFRAHHGRFVLVHPMRILLVVAVPAIAGVLLLVWAIRRRLVRRRARAAVTR